MSELYVGVDSGTQGSKAVVVDRGKHLIVAESYSPHELIEDNTGKREQEPAWWITAHTLRGRP